MRKVVIAAVVLLVVVAAALFAVSRFNTYLTSNREWLARQASTALGREVSFAEVGVSLRGGLGAAVTEVVIGDDPAFSREPFLKVGRAVVAVKILPAIMGRYEVARVILDTPEVTVIRQEGGLNVESIGARGRGAAAEKGAETAESEPADGGAAPLPLLVSVLRISDGRLRFVDRTQSPPAELLVEQLDFSASDVGFDSPVELDLAAAVLGAAEQNVRVEGTLGPLDSPQRAGQAPVDLDAEIGPVIIDRAKQLPVVGASIPAELSSDDPITVEVDITGTLEGPAVVASFDASDAGLRYGDLFRKPEGTRFAVEANVTRSADAIEVGDFDLQLAGAHLRGSGTLGTGPSLPLDFQIEGSGVPLDGWGELFAAAEGLDVDGELDLDVRARGPVAERIPRLDGTVSLKNVSAVQPGGGVRISDLTTQILLQGDRVEIPPTRFAVAGEPVSFSATVTSLENLAAEFSLTAAKLRLAALGAGGEGVAQEEVVNDLSVEGTVVAPQGEPQARITVRSSGGSVRGVGYSSLDTEIGVADKRVSLKQLAVEAFDGLVTGSGSVDPTAENPEFEFRGRVRGLDLASILEYLGAASVKMTGKIEGDVNLRGAGAEQQQVMKALTGDGALEVRDGLLEGVNIAEVVLSSVTGVPGLGNLLGPEVRQKYPSIFSQSDTAFDALRARTTIAGGVATLEEMLLAARDYSLRGDGSFSFTNALDVAVDFIASDDLTQQLRGDVKELKYLLDADGRLLIPVRLTGSLPGIRPQPNTEYLAKQLSGALVSQGLQKGLDALLGNQPEEVAPEAEAGPAADDAPRRDAPEQLIRKGLEGLLGGGETR
jgi:uncharacterized protein involved in outer membrane biogenesis